MEKIYAIVHKTEKLAYVGRTSRTIEQRFYEHCHSALNGVMSTLYEALRHDPDGFELMLCEEGDKAIEEKWETQFRDDGYSLLNDTGTNNKRPKKRDTQKERLWRQVNNVAVADIDSTGRTVQQILADLQQGTRDLAARWEANRAKAR